MKKRSGISRALLTIILILLVLIALSLFFIAGKKILERLFIGGI